MKRKRRVTLAQKVVALVAMRQLEKAATKLLAFKAEIEEAQRGLEKSQDQHPLDPDFDYSNLLPKIKVVSKK